MGGERGPMSDEDIHNKARELTTKVEQGDNVSKAMNEIPFQDRARIAHEMQNINDQDRAGDKHIPKLDVTYAKDGGGSEHVMSMSAEMDPNAWVFKDSKQVYDLPAACHNLMMFTDGLKMVADIQDSQRLQNPDVYFSALDK